MIKILCMIVVLLNYDSRAIDITFDYQYDGSEPEPEISSEPMTTSSPSTTSPSTTTSRILLTQIETNAPAQRTIDLDLFKSVNGMMMKVI